MDLSELALYLPKDKPKPPPPKEDIENGDKDNNDKIVVLLSGCLY